MASLVEEVEVQGPYCTGKTGEMAKTNPYQGKHREFGNFAKTQGFFLFKFKFPDSKARITQCVFLMLRWQLSPTQIKCTCNANDSTYITPFFSKSNTLWVILKENVISFQIFIGFLVINKF